MYIIKCIENQTTPNLVGKFLAVPGSGKIYTGTMKLIQTFDTLESAQEECNDSEITVHVKELFG